MSALVLLMYENTRCQTETYVNGYASVKVYPISGIAIQSEDISHFLIQLSVDVVAEKPFFKIMHIRTQESGSSIKRRTAMSEIIHAQNIIVRVTESYPHIGCPSRQKTIRVGIQVESIDFIPVFGVYLGRYPKPFWGVESSYPFLPCTGFRGEINTSRSVKMAVICG